MATIFGTQLDTSNVAAEAAAHNAQIRARFQQLQSVVRGQCEEIGASVSNTAVLTPERPVEAPVQPVTNSYAPVFAAPVVDRPAEVVEPIVQAPVVQEPVAEVVAKPEQTSPNVFARRTFFERPIMNLLIPSAVYSKLCVRSSSCSAMVV